MLSVSFSTASTWLAAHSKLTHVWYSSKLSRFHYMYFNRLSRVWNSLPPLIFLNDSLRLNWKLSPFFGHHFKLSLIPFFNAVIFFSVLVGPAPQCPTYSTSVNLLVNYVFLLASNVTFEVCQYWFVYIFLFLCLCLVLLLLLSTVKFCLICCSIYL